jgi:2-keto-4-pentenoate hydratase
LAQRPASGASATDIITLKACTTTDFLSPNHRHFVSNSVLVPRSDRMMTKEQIEAASDVLWDHWRNGRRMPWLPETMRPLTREEGYAIQAQLERHSAFPLFGWKIAATSRAGQAHIAVEGPLGGRLLRERAHKGGERIRFGENHMRVAEAEFAFRVGRDLPPRATLYSADEVLSAVASLHPAIEVPDSRYEDFTVVGAAQLIADNACAHDFVLGRPAPENWKSIDLSAHRVSGSVAGRLQREGVGGNVLGDPRTALTWLVNELSSLHLTLHAGEVVTTGTCLVPLPIEPGDRVRADFGEIGSVEVSLGG